MMTQSKSLIHFLRQELAIPANSINLALRDQPCHGHQLIMTLWQYGLVTKEQLEHLFDWLDNNNLSEKF
ncbi:MAG TPA: DUF2949 domain-containing protein [Cyanothece sp. UBA12306]|nr:DUF2949 domain-containing protein [Cyanothece sp. UBA12306]